MSVYSSAYFLSPRKPYTRVRSEEPSMEARQLALFKEPSHLHRHTADRGSSSARVTGRGPGSLKYRTYYSLPPCVRNGTGKSQSV